MTKTFSGDLRSGRTGELLVAGNTGGGGAMHVSPTCEDVRAQRALVAHRRIRTFGVFWGARRNHLLDSRSSQLTDCPAFFVSRCSGHLPSRTRPSLGDRVYEPACATLNDCTRNRWSLSAGSRRLPPKVLLETDREGQKERRGVYRDVAMAVACRLT